MSFFPPSIWAHVAQPKNYSCQTPLQLEESMRLSSGKRNRSESQRPHSWTILLKEREWSLYFFFSLASFLEYGCDSWSSSSYFEPWGSMLRMMEHQDGRTVMEPSYLLPFWILLHEKEINFHLVSAIDIWVRRSLVCVSTPNTNGCTYLTDLMRSNRKFMEECSASYSMNAIPFPVFLPHP